MPRKIRYTDIPVIVGVKDGTTELRRELEKGYEADLQKIRSLIEKGADPDVTSKAVDFLPTAVMAVRMDDLDLLERLVALGADLEIPDPTYQLTPLLAAVEEGDVDMVPLLVDANVDVNTMDVDGQTALHLAVLGAKHGILGYLLKIDDIDIERKDQEGLTALAVASKIGNKEAMRLLMRAGA